MLRCLQSVPIFRKAILGILSSLLLVGCSNSGALESQESTIGSSVVQENKENLPTQVEEVWGVRSFTFEKEYDEARARSINEGSIIKLAKNGKVVFSGGMISSVADYQIQRELFGGDIGLIGYPTAQGSGTAANFWGTQLAINALSSNQEAAWEFVKYFVLHGYTGNGFPLVKEQLEKVLAEAMQKMQRYMEIQDIIDEEAQAYFREQKSLEDTAAIIQSRVTLYLEEQL